MRNIRTIVDNYLNYAFSIDALIIILYWFLFNKFSFISVVFNQKSSNLDILGNIIGASVSLAGFILASLTIIVAIRSNIANKLPEQSKSPLELFFSIGTFKTIVKVFKIAITELIICFILSYIIWTISENVSNELIFKTIIILIYLMSVSTIRSLFILFLLINTDTNNKASHNNCLADK